MRRVVFDCVVFGRAPPVFRTIMDEPGDVPNSASVK